MDNTHSSLATSTLLVERERVIATALAFINAPSPTGDAGPAADALASLLRADGFEVERREAGHPNAPAVVARLDSGRPGPTLQFNGHLDTVHLPFVPAKVANGRIEGRGASDMKGGLAAAVEALRALRQAGGPRRGAVLLTAHDLHEAPWGDGRQLDRLIAEGVVGDAVLIPEPLHDRLPIAGRGQACWSLTIERDGLPVHEVFRPEGTLDVLAIGAEVIRRLGQYGRTLDTQVDPIAGRASIFIGRFAGGEMFNQVAKSCHLEGTRRWLPETSPKDVEAEFRRLLTQLEAETGARFRLDFCVVRGAFRLDHNALIAHAFQSALVSLGEPPLPLGPKPFVDDGNSFWAAGIPAITHGPLAGGQHTQDEWVEIDDLVRIARRYVATAHLFCEGTPHG